VPRELIRACAVPILVAWQVTLGFADRLCRSPVLVDDAAEESRSPHRAVEHNDAGVSVRWVGAGLGSGVDGAG
jgi:hypothetical protein